MDKNIFPKQEPKECDDKLSFMGSPDIKPDVNDMKPEADSTAQDDGDSKELLENMCLPSNTEDKGYEEKLTEVSEN